MIKNQAVFNLVTGREIGTEEDLHEMEEAIAQQMNTTTRTRSMAATWGSDTISGTVPNYSYNAGDTCGSTAAAMWLKWYDNNVDGRYVPDSLSTANGQALCKHLIPYIDDNWYYGSNPIDVVSGIYDYLKTQGITYWATTELASISMLHSRVTVFNRPYILLLSKEPKYGNH